jgi:molybdenum cofactor synthesis domain-containing protein
VHALRAGKYYDFIAARLCRNSFRNGRNIRPLRLKIKAYPAFLLNSSLSYGQKAALCRAVFAASQTCFYGTMNQTPAPTAAVLIIGNEVLSGRTQDANLNYIALKLSKIGIRLCEARIVADVEQEIVSAVNALRAKYTYLFTTGGIGPTHDDITADSIAKAFGVKVGEHPEARARLAAHYKSADLSAARLRMARIPLGGDLIDNPVSAAPGFRVENVYVLAGVPNIMQAMMDNVAASLTHGPAIHSLTVSGFVAESKIAEELGVIAAANPQLDIGSYPWFRMGRFGTALVTRGTDEAAVRRASDAIFALVAKYGGEPVMET